MASVLPTFRWLFARVLRFNFCDFRHYSNGVSPKLRTSFKFIFFWELILVYKAMSSWASSSLRASGFRDEIFVRTINYLRHEIMTCIVGDLWFICTYFTRYKTFFKYTRYFSAWTTILSARGYQISHASSMHEWVNTMCWMELEVPRTVLPFGTLTLHGGLCIQIVCDKIGCFWAR